MAKDHDTAEFPDATTRAERIASEVRDQRVETIRRASEHSVEKDLSGLKHFCTITQMVARSEWLDSEGAEALEWLAVETWERATRLEAAMSIEVIHAVRAAYDDALKSAAASSDQN